MLGNKKAFEAQDYQDLHNLLGAMEVVQPLRRYTFIPAFNKILVNYLKWITKAVQFDFRKTLIIKIWLDKRDFLFIRVNFNIVEYVYCLVVLVFTLPLIKVFSCFSVFPNNFLLLSPGFLMSMAVLLVRLSVPTTEILVSCECVTAYSLTET